MSNEALGLKNGLCPSFKVLFFRYLLLCGCGLLNWQVLQSLYKFLSKLVHLETKIWSEI